MHKNHTTGLAQRQIFNDWQNGLLNGNGPGLTKRD